MKTKFKNQKLKIKNMNIWLIIIILFASILRLWQLDFIPPHLTPDEASLGYNAYSILKTGKDEYGQTLPVIFKSFGDYKPGLYVYAAVPSILIFGLNEFAVRFPSALAGILSIVLLYLIVKRFFNSERLALLASFLLAISPWHIHFSRGAWEVNLSLFLTIAGVYFFLKAFEKPKYLAYSAVSFALTLIAYQGAKLSTGIVLLLLALFYWKELIKFNKKFLAISSIVGLVIAAPILLSLFQGKAGRLTVFSVFSYPRPVEYLQPFLDQGQEKIGDINYYLFHSENLNFIRGVAGRYFNHFSARFLFFEGDWANPRHSAPYHGMLTLADLVLFLGGVIYVTRNRLNKKIVIILLWLFLAPIPSVLSRDQVHAVRSLNMVIPLTVFLSFGLLFILDAFKRQKMFFVLFALAYLGSYIYFLDAYFIHLPRLGSKYWEYGFKQIVETVTLIQNNYKQIKVQQSYSQPYIYFLFFQKYDPFKYQKNAKLTENEFGDVGQVENLDNICFCPIDWSVTRGNSGTLVVGDEVRIPTADSVDPRLFRTIREINYLDSKFAAYKIIEVK